MATAAWTANTAYSINSVVRATTVLGTGLIFKAVVAGTSGVTQPVWPATIGNQIQDNTITWQAVSVISGLFLGDAPGAIIELFELQLFQELHGSNDIYRFHAGANALNDNTDIIWAGNTYTRYPVEAEDFEYSGTGQLPRPKIRISNILSTISAILADINQASPGSDLTGAKVTRIRTLARYLDAANYPAPGALLLEDDSILLLEDGSSFMLEATSSTEDSTAEFPREIYFVDRKSTENNQLVEFELASSLDLAGVLAPKRQTIANICQWRYRRYNSETNTFDYTKVDCPYNKDLYFKADGTPTANPAEDVCDKRLTSCKLRFDTAFLTGSVTTGSTTLGSLSTTELSRINPGDEIQGFGIAPGTTVAAKSVSTITLSQAALGTSVVVTTGTRSLLGLSITVTSTTGLLPGMAVSGSQIPAGVRISSIDTVNKIVYLNTSINPLIYLFGSLLSGTLFRSSTGTDYIQMSSVSGISPGDYVNSSNVYQNTTVSSVNPLTNRVFLSNLQKVDVATPVGISVTFGVRITATSATYTFTANDLYTIRPNAVIPFGSFPAVGTIK
jgi:phage-related protein